MALCRLGMTFCMAGIFLFTFAQWYDDAVVYFFKGNIILLLLYTIVYALFLQAYGGYKIGALRYRELMFSNGVAALLANATIYLVMSLIAFRMLSPWPLLLCLLLQMLAASATYYCAFRINERLYPPADALLARTSDKHDLALTEQFIKKSTRYIIKDITVDEEYASIVSRLGDYPVLIIGAIDAELRNRLMAYCFEHDKQLFIIPSMEDIILNNAVLYMAEDLLVYRCRNRAFTADQLLVKRIMDVVISGLALLLSLPVTLLTALAIKMQDGGPVFYEQTRLTRGGRRFKLIKFRSMIIDAEKATGAVLAAQGDKRITRVGRLIRACRIDELPQLWNVLKGDMSLVGPRPERPEIFAQICEEFPQFTYRLKVKAGITGYAQLYGKYNTSFEDKVRLDLLYIEKASILQDMHLLFYTFKILFMKESAEGVQGEEESD